jgi:hypothetical protein
MNRPAKCEVTGSAGAAGKERSAHIAVAIKVTAINCRAFFIKTTDSLSVHFILASSQP